MSELIHSSPSHFLVHALGMTPEPGSESGQCITCGIDTKVGFTGASNFTFNKTFTDLAQCQGDLHSQDVICEACAMLSSNHPSKIAKMYTSRLRRCLVTQSGKLFRIGNRARLKYMLQNLPDEPFLFMDSWRKPSMFMHHIWKCRVSMDKKAFFYCDDFGSHFLRLDRILAETAMGDMTVLESNFFNIMNNDKIKPEQSLDPSIELDDKKKTK